MMVDTRKLAMSRIFPSFLFCEDRWRALILMFLSVCALALLARRSLLVGYYFALRLQRGCGIHRARLYHEANIEYQREKRAPRL